MRACVPLGGSRQNALSRACWFVRGIRSKLNEYRASEVVLLNQRLAYQVMSSNSSLGPMRNLLSLVRQIVKKIDGISSAQRRLVVVFNSPVLSGGKAIN